MFTKLKKDIDKSLKSYLQEADVRLALKKSSPVLYSGVCDFLSRGGKRIRPILYIISYRGYARKKSYSYKQLIKSSLSFELLHDFLLIHDDVIDNSPLRRGKPTLHRVYNRKLKVKTSDKIGSDLAIVAGDIIYALAVEAFMSLDTPPHLKEKALLEFTKVTASTGIGEFIDVVNNIKKIEKVKKRDVFLTYILKTAKYTFESPLVVGALLAGAEKKEIKKLSRLGIMLGQAFQLQDDMLDVFSSSKAIGKPILSDLAESKKTLLVWKTYDNLTGEDKKEVKNILEKKKKTYQDLLKFRKLIRKAKADRYSMGIILYLLDESLHILSKLKMKKEYRLLLEEFIEASFKTAHELKKQIR